MHYEPKYTYPLIVWLHSPDVDERQLLKIMPEISTRNYVAAAPRGLRCDGSSSTRVSYDWPQTEDAIEQAERRVFASIAAARRKWNVATQRMFLAGFDSGGTMAYRVAMNHPNKFAGVLSICGRFPRGHTPLGRLTEARKLSVFLAVGRDSCQYSPVDACEDLRLFHTAGLSIALRQYPSAHQLTPQMLRDVDRWIIEQITALSDPPPAADDE